MLTRRQGPDLPLGVAPQARQVRTETWGCPPCPQPTRSPSAAPVVSAPPSPDLARPRPSPWPDGQPLTCTHSGTFIPCAGAQGSLTHGTGLGLPPAGSSSGASFCYTSSKAKPCTSCRPPTSPPQGPPPSSPSCSSSSVSSSPSPRGRLPLSGSLSVSSRLHFRPPAFTRRAQAWSSSGMNTFAARWWCPP